MLRSGNYIVTTSFSICKFILTEFDFFLIIYLSHPTIPQFADLGLKWYAIPAVSGMLLEVGGVQFPACPFNGWYAVSEIATADFLNIQRYNLLNVSIKIKCLNRKLL